MAAGDLTLAVTLAMTLKTTFKKEYGINTTRFTQDILTRTISDSLANGEAIDQAEFVYHNTGSLAATTIDIDCYGGISDPFGVVINAKSIKCLLVVNKSVVVGEVLKVGGDAASVPMFGAVGDYIIVEPNGFLLLWAPSAAGYTVTQTTGDIIQLDSVAATIAYDIVIIGSRA